jgi:hypothetical protein
MKISLPEVSFTDLEQNENALIHGLGIKSGQLFFSYFVVY